MRRGVRNPRASGRRLASGSALALAVVLVVAPSDAADRPPALRVELSGRGGAWRAGDRETVTATVTNMGPTPVEHLVLMLVLVDATRVPAVPLGLEDWTPTPGAVRAAALPPRGQLTGAWPLRIVQAGRLLAFATVVAGDGRSVTHSPPLMLTIAPTRNLTPRTVLPVVLGMPLAVVAGGLCWWRRRRGGGWVRTRCGGKTP